MNLVPVRERLLSIWTITLGQSCRMRSKRRLDRAIKSPRKVIVTKFLDKNTLSSIRILHIVRDMLERVGLEGHLDMVFPSIPLLTQEFLASLEWVHKYDNTD